MVLVTMARPRMRARALCKGLAAEQQVVTGLSRHMLALVHVPPALTTRMARGLVVVVLVLVPFLLPFMVCVVLARLGSGRACLCRKV